MTYEQHQGLPAPGDTFAGKYTIIRVLGEGGVGVVFEAQHQRLNQRVAIKILRSEVRKSEEWLTRFDREARASVALRGPNVARVYDVDSLPDGTPYIVMELLEGHDLASEVGSRGSLPITEAVGYMLEACAAMAEAHAHGIVHRDLAPKNVFLTNEAGRRVIKVLDFGISKIVTEQSNVTATDEAFGTPNYVSPEQIRASANVDARADIWSLGVILFELLSGTIPFQGDSAAAVIASVVADPPKSLQRLRPDLPKKLTAAVMKALEKDPEQRFQRVEDFAQAIAPFGPLRPYSQDFPTVVTANVNWSRPDIVIGRSEHRGRAMWLVIGLIAVAIAGPALFFGLRGDAEATQVPLTQATTIEPATTSAAPLATPQEPPTQVATTSAAPLAASSTAPEPTVISEPEPTPVKPRQPTGSPRKTTKPPGPPLHL